MAFFGFEIGLKSQYNGITTEARTTSPTVESELQLNTTKTISINGQKAVDIGYKFQNGYCYRGIYNHGKRIAQLEVVLDEPGQYNGYDIKWVDVSYIEPKNVDKVIKQLRRLGFGGCVATISDERDGQMSNEVFITI